jgi:hypothetical protein
MACVGGQVACRRSWKRRGDLHPPTHGHWSKHHVTSNQGRQELCAMSNQGRQELCAMSNQGHQELCAMSNQGLIQGGRYKEQRSPYRI